METEKPVVELDLSGERPLVRVDGVVMEGVSRATLEVEAFETPVLLLRLVCFEVKGGAVPQFMASRMRRALDEPQGG
ncbi:hypothetical protein [Paraburkholderia silvatlantica]|uniref:hypothetical protein n=1 Tax=Paraburkholderia silvatlantica TaxID=321895 RepID=UPI0037520E4F